MGIIAGDDKRHQNAEPADPFILGVAQFAKAVDRVGLCRASDGKLRQHNRQTDQNNNGQVDQDKGSAAALISLARELPNVPQADGRSGCRQNKADLTAPLCAIRFHIV